MNGIEFLEFAGFLAAQDRNEAARRTMLADIRSERNRADYDLANRRIERLENVRTVIERASEIHRLVMGFRSEPTEPLSAMESCGITGW
jgi:hypothetical protein